MRPARSIPIGPVTCREFLVTTPAKNCQNPATETIRSVNLPMRVGPALAKLGTRGDDPSEARWVPWYSLSNGMLRRLAAAPTCLGN
jgi:hypothetical protein